MQGIRSFSHLPLTLLLITSVTGIMLALNSCDTPDETPDYSPRYFGPAVDSRINIEDISQLEDIVLNQQVSATDINSNFQGQRTVPAFSLNQPIGPFPFEITDVFEEVTTDTLIFKITITNTLPIPINPGTEMVFRNESNGSLIYRKVIEEPVQPGDDILVEETVVDKLVESDINFFLENFTSAGSGGQQVDFNNSDKADFEFELVFLDIEEAIIDKGESYTVTDTTDVSYTGSTDTASGVSGEVYISLNNLFPLNFDLQLLFLDENEAALDSVLTSRIRLEGAPVNSDGIVIGENTRTVDTIEISNEQLQALKDANRLSTRFTASTLTEDFQGNPISSVTLEIEDRSFLRLQVGVDAKIVAE